MTTSSRLSKSGLSRALGIERHRLTAILSRVGAPVPDRSRRYDAEAVARFVAKHEEGGTDALRRARLRLVLLQCEKAQRELDTSAGKVVPLDEVQRAFTQHAQRMQHTINVRFVQELPGKLAGLDACECRIRLRETYDEVVQRLIEVWDEIFNHGKPYPPKSEAKSD